MLASVSRRGSLRGTEGEVQRMDVDADVDETASDQAPPTVPLAEPTSVWVNASNSTGSKFMQNLHPNDKVVRTMVFLKGGQHETKLPNKTPEAQWALLQERGKIKFWTDFEMLKDYLVQRTGAFDLRLAKHIERLDLSSRASGLFFGVYNIVILANNQRDLLKKTSREFQSFCAAASPQLANANASLTHMALDICKALLKPPSILVKSNIPRHTSLDTVAYFCDVGDVLLREDHGHVALLCVVEAIIQAINAFGDKKSGRMDLQTIRSPRHGIRANFLYSHVMKVYDCEPDHTHGASFYVAPNQNSDGAPTFTIEISKTDDDFDAGETSYGVALLEPGHPGLKHGGPHTPPCVYVFINNGGVFVQYGSLVPLLIETPFSELSLLQMQRTRVEFKIEDRGVVIILSNPNYQNAQWSRLYELYTCPSPKASFHWRALIFPKGRRISAFRVWNPPVIIAPPGYKPKKSAAKLALTFEEQRTASGISFIISSNIWRVGSARMEASTAIMLKHSAEHLAVEWNDRAISKCAATVIVPNTKKTYWALDRKPASVFKFDNTAKLYAKMDNLHTKSVSSLEFLEDYEIGIVVTENAFPAGNVDFDSSIFIRTTESFQNFLYNVAVAGKIFIGAEVAHNDMFARNCLWRRRDLDGTPQRMTIIDTDRSCLLQGDQNRDTLGQRTIQSLGTYVLEIVFKATKNNTQIHTGTDIYRDLQKLQFALERAVGSGEVFKCTHTIKLLARIEPNIPRVVEPWICYDGKEQSEWDSLRKSGADKSKFVDFYCKREGHNFRIAKNKIVENGAHSRAIQLITDLINIATGRV